MAAKVIELSITRSPQGTLTLQDVGGTTKIVAGSQYDHYGCILKFTREAEESASDLMLYCEGEGIFLGQENEFPIPSKLTQKKSAALQAAYVRDADTLEHTNQVTLEYRESQARVRSLDDVVLEKYFKKVNGE